MGSFCAIVISVAPGCTTLHGVAPGRVQVVKEFPLAASRIDACRGSTRLDPRSRKRQDTRKTARLLLHPNRARFGQQSRTTARKTPEKRAKKFRILITPFARFQAGHHCPTSWKMTFHPAIGGIVSP